MKLKNTFLLVIFLGVVFSACKKEDNVVDEDTTYVSFKVEGNAKNLNPCTATVKQVVTGSEMIIKAQGEGNTISLRFIKNYVYGINEYLPLLMEYNIQNGTYLSNLFSGYPVAAIDFYNAMTVTSETDKNATGTFKFKGTNSTLNPQEKIITEGKFSCKIVRGQ